MLAVLAGVGVYLGGMLAAAVVIATLSVTFRGQAGVFQAFVPGNPALAIAGVVGSGVFSLIGAYVCARMARRNERRLTAIMASVSIAARFAVGLVAWVLEQSVVWWSWWGTAQIAATVACAIAGCELGRRRNVADARNANVATAA